jgi:hypothetical protein
MGFGGNISDDEHLTTSGRHARKRQHRDDGENDGKKDFL